MAFSSVGSAITAENMFNSGRITFGSDQFVDVTDLSIDQKFDEKSIRALNSIFKRNIKRSTYEVEISFTTNTNPKALQDLFYSSSSIVSGTETLYAPLDGQQVNVPSVLLTCYTNDAGTQGYQYVVANPVILEMNQSNGTEEFAEFEIKMACTQLTNARRIYG